MSHHHHHHDGFPAWRVALVGGAAGLAWFGAGQSLAPWTGVDLISWLATAVGGWPIFREAGQAVLERRMTMELSMTLALVAALLVGEGFTALVIVMFVLIAEWLEGLTVSRQDRALEDLAALLPERMTVLRGGEPREVPAGSVEVGETVMVPPGQSIPVDGEVLVGQSFADEAAITGEPLPAEKTVGSQVYAGSINQAGALEVRVDNLGSSTAFGRIVEAVHQAQHTRSPIQRLADRLAGYLVDFALLCAAVTWLATGNVTATISVIIVAGACGVAAGTPLAIVGALGRAAHHGAVFKGGEFLEALGVVDTVVFDKTGTLTTARARVGAIRCAPGRSADEVLEAAATAESRSEHPLAGAVLAEAAARGLKWNRPEAFTYRPGLGIVCDRLLVGSRRLLDEHQVDSNCVPGRSGAVTEIAVARDGEFLGILEVDDPVRPEAPQAMEGLRRLGIRTLLLTGDSPAVAEAVAERLGVDEVEAGLLPEQKQQRVQRLVEEGRTVAMVGDGINDAPALAAATVGIAMGSGTAVARECADVVLLGNDLERMLLTVRLARQCRSIIWFNFAGTVLVDLVGIGLAAWGYLTPILAALIHVTSELAFILNSARLLPRGGAAGKPTVPASATPAREAAEPTSGRPDRPGLARGSRPGS